VCETKAGVGSSVELHHHVGNLLRQALLLAREGRRQCGKAEREAGTAQPVRRHAGILVL
jgi:hypothetical protein